MNIVKTFDSFEKGITELSTNVPELLEFIGETLTEDAVISNLTEIIKNDIPSMKNPNYPAVNAFSINSNEVGFKSAKYLAFGWKLITTAEAVTYSFRVTIVNAAKLETGSKIINDLKEKGWRLLKPAQRKAAS